MKMPIGATLAAMSGMRMQIKEVQHWIDRKKIVEAVSTLEVLEESFEYFSPYLGTYSTEKFRSIIEELDQILNSMHVVIRKEFGLDD